MSRKYKFRNPEGMYFISTATVYWLDVFTRRIYKDIIIDSLIYCIREKGLTVYAYIIMSNHIHLIIGKRKEEISFSGIVRDFKKYTSTNLINAIKENPQESRKEWMLWMMQRAGKKNGNNTNYQFWQQDNHPI
jgi:putative transposase